MSERKQTAKDELFHKLLRTIVRVYYNDETLIVLEGLIELDVAARQSAADSGETYSGVKAIDVAALTHVPKGRTRTILTQLVAHGLIGSVFKQDAPEEEKDMFSNLKMTGFKPKVYKRVDPEAQTFYLDAARLWQRLQYRHARMSEEIEKDSQKREQVLYKCPNPKCPIVDQRGPKLFTLDDLVLRAGSSVDQSFRCLVCSAIQLTPTADFDDNGLTQFLATSGRSHPWKNPSELKKVKVTSYPPCAESSRPSLLFLEPSVSTYRPQYPLPIDPPHARRQPRSVWTAGGPEEQWIEYNFAPMVVVPTHYSLRHVEEAQWQTQGQGAQGGAVPGALRNWVLEAAEVGEASFALL